MIWANTTATLSKHYSKSTSDKKYSTQNKLISAVGQTKL